MRRAVPGCGSALRPCPMPSPVVVGAVEVGEVPVGFGEVERFGFLRIVLGPVFDGGVAGEAGTQWVRGARVAWRGPFQGDLVPPARAEVVLVADPLGCPGEHVP